MPNASEGTNAKMTDYQNVQPAYRQQTPPPSVQYQQAASAYQQPAPQAQQYQQPAPQYAYQQPAPVITGGAKAGYLFLCLFLGVIGFIIAAAVSQGRSDAYAYEATKFSLIGLLISVVIGIVVFLMLWGFLFAIVAAMAAAA